MKTKVLINCRVTAQLIYAFVFANVRRGFSHDMAHIVPALNLNSIKNVAPRRLGRGFPSPFMGLRSKRGKGALFGNELLIFL